MKGKGKGRFVLGMVVGIIVCVLVVVGDVFLTVGDVAWKAYIENELAPNIVLALTTIGTILLAALPIISKVTSAVNNFKSATKDVNDTVANNSKNEKRIAELEERLDRIETASENTEKIARIAFCNMDELVKKGYANEIAKVGQDEDEEKEVKS